MPSTTAEISVLMNWFPSQDAVRNWGGPAFTFPYTRESFIEDIRWSRVRSFSLQDATGLLVAFGQLYERSGRIHLSRLAVRPGLRGRGFGKRLIGLLLAEGRRLYGDQDFSLFVRRNNEHAQQCYTSLGFVFSDYPDDMPFGDVCSFMILPAETLTK